MPSRACKWNGGLGGIKDLIEHPGNGGGIKEKGGNFPRGESFLC